MQTVFHPAQSRGAADHGWLKSHHTFSFSSYYNPERLRFGMLRVLNDDEVAPGRGFSRHPHENMEIISIPLEGDLEHKDSMGNTSVIRQGDIQAMSAGTGLFHSEYNKNADRPVKFLQIWVFPNQQNVEPKYSQITLQDGDLQNKLTEIVAPAGQGEGVTIQQDAWFHLGELEAGKTFQYELKRSGNGVYAFLIEGKTEVAGQTMNRRDGLGIWKTDSIAITATENSKLLLMEVPMNP